MNKHQIWFLIIFLLIVGIGLVCIRYKEYTLFEKQAWLNCIKENDQLSAKNLVCRSLYPEPYKLFNKEFSQ